MNNLTVCGGFDDNAFYGLNICESLDLDSGSWVESHSLHNSRCRHSSWDVDESVYLIGGDDGAGTDLANYEILSNEGSVTVISTTFARQ